MKISVYRHLSLAVLLSVFSISGFGQQAPPDQSAPADKKAEEKASDKKQADDKKKQDDEKQKVEETVVVTATRSSRAEDTLPMSVSVIKRDEVRMTPAPSLDDILRDIPAVEAPRTSSIAQSTRSNQFSMRGIAGNRALILVDGVPLTDPYFGNPEWDRVDSERIDRIEVVRGANASLFGNLAMGGTLNVLTSPVSSDEVRLTTSGGTFSMGRLDLAADNMITPTFGLGVTVHRFTTAGYIRLVPEERGPVDTASSDGITSFGTRADYDPVAALRGWFRANLMTDDLGQGTPLQVTRRRVLDLATGNVIAIGPSSDVSISAFHQHENNNIANSSVNSTRTIERPGNFSDIGVGDLGGSVVWSHSSNSALPFVSIGADVRRVEAEENHIDFSPTGPVGHPADTHILGGEQLFSGIFGEASWTPTSRFEVLASARVDTWHNTNGHDEVVGGPMTNYPDKNATELDPRFSMRYALTSTLAIRGAAYRAFHAPSIADLYRSSVSGRVTVFSNPNLHPEILQGGEVGLTWIKGNIHVESTFYDTTIKGLVQRVSLAGPNTAQNQNIGAERTKGIETIVSTEYGRFGFDGGYIYNDAVLVSNPTNPAFVGNMAADVPRHTLTASARYRSFNGFSAFIRGRLISRTYHDANNTLILPGHTVIDASISHPITQRADLFVTCENLLNHQYLADVDTGDHLGEPREVFAGVRLHLPY